MNTVDEILFAHITVETGNIRVSHSFVCGGKLYEFNHRIKVQQIKEFNELLLGGRYSILSHAINNKIIDNKFTNFQGSVINAAEFKLDSYVNNFS